MSQVTDFLSRLHHPSPIKFDLPASELVFVEVFAGRATLTAQVKQSLHLQCIAIDHVVKQPRSKITQLDLTKRTDQDVFFNMIAGANIAAAHFAPVCGTASKAREIPMPATYTGKPLLPLRSADHLLGVPSLSGSDKQRVAAANTLYAVTALASIILLKRGTIVSIENPSNSYFWPIAEQLCTDLGLADHWNSLENNQFAACMFGSKRNKLTTWRATAGAYADLRRSCDASHQHEPWRPQLDQHGRISKLPTAEEAAYTPELSQAVAVCLGSALAKLDVIFPSSLSKAANPRKVMRTEQHRLPQLVSEFFLITDSVPKALDSKDILLPPILDQGGDSMLDQVDFEDATIQCQPQTLFAFNNKPRPGDKVKGVFRSPLNFLKCATQLHHPIDFACPLPDELVKTLGRILNWGPAKLVKHRAERAAELTKLVAELDAREIDLLSSLSPTPRRILSGKRMKLWKLLAERYQCPDTKILDEMLQGCKLTGTGTRSDLFPAGCQMAATSPQHLKSQHVWLRHHVVSSCKPSLEEDDDWDCWEQTLDEVKDGWMEGPFLDQQAVSEHLGTTEWLCSRRFPLRQGEKLRLIDDAKQSKINTAYHASNKLVLQDMDTLIALISQMIKHFVTRGEFYFTCSDGEVVSGRVAGDWGGKVQLVGRTLDLSSAYKQMPTSDDEPWTRVIAVYNPKTKSPQFFISLALPFGCTSAVYQFNRASKGLWWLMQRMFSVVCTTYFDDFPTVEPEATAPSARTCQEILLRAIGWKFASEGRKALEYSKRFDVLGITINLEQSSQGTFVVTNKDSRVDKILSTLDQFLTRKAVSQAEAAQFHGVLNFAQGQYLGRVLQPAMRFFQKVATFGWHNSDLVKLAEVASFLVAAVSGAPPRSISVSDCLQPALLFTDGACEPIEGGHQLTAGLVVWDPATNFRQVHEAVIPDRVKKAWQKTGKHQLIAACELFPILVAWHWFSKRFLHRRVLVFIDNSSVKAAAAKGASSQIELFSMLSLICLEQSRNPTLVWYTRVPSKSNCADGPSRGRAKQTAAELGADLGDPLSLPEPYVQFLEGSMSYPALMDQLTEVWNKGES